MKKTVRILGVLILIIFVILAGVNIWMGQEPQRLLDGQQIALYADSGRVTEISMADVERLARPFTATFQRKVGGAEEHHYLGVSLQVLLTQYDVDVPSEGKVSITAIDSYSISLTPQEIEQDDNVYLVYEQDGEALGDNFGPYMLVVKGDEISTRWNRNVVSIEVEGGADGT